MMGQHLEQFLNQRKNNRHNNHGCHGEEYLEAGIPDLNGLPCVDPLHISDSAVEVLSKVVDR